MNDYLWYLLFFPTRGKYHDKNGQRRFVGQKEALKSTQLHDLIYANPRMMRFLPSTWYLNLNTIIYPSISITLEGISTWTWWCCSSRLHGWAAGACTRGSWNWRMPPKKSRICGAVPKDGTWRLLGRSRPEGMFWLSLRVQAYKDYRSWFRNCGKFPISLLVNMGASFQSLKDPTRMAGCNG